MVLWVVPCGQSPVVPRGWNQPRYQPARVHQRPALDKQPHKPGHATQETTMGPAFLRYLVQTQAADPYLQAYCDAPRQALAPAATPGTETRHATAPLTGNAITGTREQAAAP